MLPLPVWTAATLCASESSGCGNEVEAGGDKEGRVDGEGDGEVWQTRKMDRETMRESVGEFLLDGGEGE